MALLLLAPLTGGAQQRTQLSVAPFDEDITNIPVADRPLRPAEHIDEYRGPPAASFRSGWMAFMSWELSDTMGPRMERAFVIEALRLLTAVSLDRALRAMLFADRRGLETNILAFGTRERLDEFFGPAPHAWSRGFVPRLPFFLHRFWGLRLIPSGHASGGRPAKTALETSQQPPMDVAPPCTSGCEPCPSPLVRSSQS